MYVLSIYVTSMNVLSIYFLSIYMISEYVLSMYRGFHEKVPTDTYTLRNREFPLNECTLQVPFI